MSTTPVQPDDAWWDALDPELVRQLDESTQRGLDDMKEGRITSRSKLAEEMQQFIAGLGRAPAP